MPHQDSGLVTFGDLLRYLRQRAGLTQQHFGLMVGYSHAHVARLEAGQRSPNLAAVRSYFGQALGLQHDSEMTARLIELAIASREEAPGEAPPRQIPNNLPGQATSFIGRKRELGELKHLLKSTRLLTLTGSGGAGKTRLALQLAADVADDYPDGVWLVELASIADPAFVPRAIAAVLGVRGMEDGSLTSSLLDMLRDKQLLLLLDNSEHLIDACAHFADDLLRSGSTARILATSREKLGVAGELTYRVPSLQTPNINDAINLADLTQYEAVRLFVDRAKFTLPSFVLTTANAPAVQNICCHLDGIPLAIELAAARMGVLSVEKIAERMNTLFSLLMGGSRTALPRQQTLRGVIDWSYNLLTEPERTLLRRLSVFASGWTLEACETVCADGEIDLNDVLDLLTRLVDKSLVVRSASGSGVDERYHLLGTLRKYAGLHLTDTDEEANVRNNHLVYFLQVGLAAQPQLDGDGNSDQATLLKHLAPDIDNVRSALEWAIKTSRVDAGLQLVNAYYSVWNVLARHAEILEWYQKLLNQPISEPNTTARFHALLRMSYAHIQCGEPELAGKLAEQALAISTELKNIELQFSALYRLAVNCMHDGRITQAREYLEKGHSLALTHDVMQGRKTSLFELNAYSWLYFLEGNFQQAQPLLIKWHALESKACNMLLTASIARMLGYTLLYQGDVGQSSVYFRESLIDNATLGDRQEIAGCLVALAAHATLSHKLSRAAHLFGASEALCERIQTPLLAWDLLQQRRNAAALHEQQDTSALNAAWAAGRVMTMERAMEYALVE